MARGMWQDFVDKYGFNDGESVDTLDFAAREFLVKKLNRNKVLTEKNLRAVASCPRGGTSPARRRSLSR